MTVTPDELIATLRRRAGEVRAAAGRRAEAVRTKVSAVLESRLRGGARAWIIGSLAWGGFGERSDVDLVFDDGLDDATVTAVELELGRTLNVAIDVLRLSDLPPAFAARVLREGIPLHGA